MTDREQRIFEVIEQPETKHKVEFSQRPQSRILRIRLRKTHSRISALRLLYILFPTIHSRNLEPHRPQEARKIPKAAAYIHRRPQPQRPLYLVEQSRNHLASRAIQKIVMLLIKDVGRCQRRVPPATQSQIVTEY